ncbi:MAG: hypothetical protein JWN27_3062 [Candidatus Eremiobacteraeota bacterium]|nr:hypothetical protein [Candidatus Eremiobacteraeota bacterium]
MKPGTAAHRELFCRTFIDTHDPYEPERLPWPVLDGLHLERLRSFPLWSYARSIEQRAGRMVTTFAQTLDDPLIREAVALQGVEETRHGRLMSHVLERYGIDAPALPAADPPVRREDFLVFGFGECTDSFVGFGAFALARQKQLFPESLLSIFDNVLWEEARHIAFFINWWHYEEARAGRDGLLQRAYGSVKYHLRAIVGTAQGDAGNPLPNIESAQIKAIVDGITPVMFLETALAENRRHMARLDPRLIKPRLMPALATAALIGLRMLPPLPAKDAQPEARRIAA